MSLSSSFEIDFSSLLISVVILNHSSLITFILQMNDSNDELCVRKSPNEHSRFIQEVHSREDRF